MKFLIVVGFLVCGAFALPHDALSGASGVGAGLGAGIVTDVAAGAGGLSNPTEALGGLGGGAGGLGEGVGGLGGGAGGLGGGAGGLGGGAGGLGGGAGGVAQDALSKATNAAGGAGGAGGVGADLAAKASAGLSVEKSLFAGF
ncbi:unnamed protein product [Spodoptera exigua]|nr:unnamed protein product [Spodoptera exigua]